MFSERDQSVTLAPETVRTTLDALIRARGDDYASVSRLIGRNPTYVQQFIRRGVPRRLSEDDRKTLSAYFAVPEHVLGGPADRAGRAVAATTAGLRDEQDYVLIPALGSDGDGVATALAFQARWARRLASGAIDALAVLTVTGETMAPTLTAGDAVIVDTADGAGALRDGLYALRTGGRFDIRRLTVNPATGLVAVGSDNPCYPAWEAIEPARLDLAGRVVWVARNLA